MIAPQENEPVPDIGEQQLRQAEKWIDEHDADAIGVEEIADVVGVRVWSLQRIFRLYKGCSPMQALLQRLLDRTRQAILAAGPEVTVTSVAAEFGFYAFGRFAQQYRNKFGEHPFETLARRRRVG